MQRAISIFVASSAMRTDIVVLNAQRYNNKVMQHYLPESQYTYIVDEEAKAATIDKTRRHLSLIVI